MKKRVSIIHKYALGSVLTLWLREVFLFHTGLDSFVELRVKSTLRRDGNVVVCQHVFLDGLATIVVVYRVSHCP